MVYIDKYPFFCFSYQQKFTKFCILSCIRWMRVSPTDDTAKEIIITSHNSQFVQELFFFKKFWSYIFFSLFTLPAIDLFVFWVLYSFLSSRNGQNGFCFGIILDRDYSIYCLHWFEQIKFTHMHHDLLKTKTYVLQ